MIRGKQFSIHIIPRSIIKKKFITKRFANKSTNKSTNKQINKGLRKTQ